MASPSAPAWFTVTRLSGRDFRFEWAKVSGATSYGIRYLKGPQVPPYTEWVHGIKGTTFTGRGFSGQPALRFAVYATNKDGNSAYRAVDTYWYLPQVAPTNLRVTADPVAGTATLSWGTSAYYQSGLEIERSDGVFFQIGTGYSGVLPKTWTDVSPAGDVSYRVRHFTGRVGDVVDGVQQTRVFGAWSAWSKPVFAGFTPPLAPTVSVGNTAVGVEPRVRVGFESTDGTPQSGVEVRYRKVGASSWVTVSGTTAKYLDLPNNLTAGEFEVQARSKATAASWGDWSPVQTFLMVTRPVITITNPPSVFTGGQVTATWTTTQAEGVPQSLFEVELRQSGDTLVQEMGVGAGTAVRLPFDLSNGAAYVVAVTVWCAGVSATETKSFTVDFVKPAVPLLDAVWVEEAGAHEVTVDVPSLRPIFDVFVSGGRVFFDENSPVGFG